MDVQDAKKGNTRRAYKMVALVTLWVDEGPEHEAMSKIAKQIVSHELSELFDGAGFKLGDTGYGFETAINSIEFVEKKELH